MDNNNFFISYITIKTKSKKLLYRDIFTTLLSHDLVEEGEAAPKLAKMSSTTFDAQLLVSAAVARDNPHLYFEIQSLNKFGTEPLDALCQAADRIRELVISDDEGGFVELMETGKAYMALRG
mgnify:CR=1 FL=1